MGLNTVFKNYDELVKNSPLYKHVLEILYTGLREADPWYAVKKYVSVVDGKIIVNQRSYSGFKRVHVIGFGKASTKMAQALYSILDNSIYGGIVIAPEPAEDIGPIKVLKGDHPYPGRNTLVSSHKMLDYLENEVGEDDLLFVLISGGGSALFEIPVDGLGIEEISNVTRELMMRGADIYELNTVRKHLSRVKGGKLLKYIRSKQVVSLIISDVIGDRIDVIASGPTAPDSTSYHDVKNILEKYGLWREIPERIREYVEKGVKGLVPETLKPGEQIFNRVYNLVVASNYSSLVKMRDKALELGYNALILTPYLYGEAREVGRVIASIAWSIVDHDIPIAKPAALIAGGETTVTVKGKGLGGRNQELCLSIALELEKLTTASKIIFACMGSDGIDGNSPAAGAIIDNNVVREAREKKLDPRSFLNENNSYVFFKELGRAIYTGYTGTNVNDFLISLIV